VKTAKLQFKKKTSDVQDRIEMYPDLFEEFRGLERALCATGNKVFLEAERFHAAEKRLDHLDTFFGFEHESQFRQKGIESSHWEGRRR
jgi:hypothetical protein